MSSQPKGTPSSQRYDDDPDGGPDSDAGYSADQRSPPPSRSGSDAGYTSSEDEKHSGAAGGAGTGAGGAGGGGKDPNAQDQDQQQGNKNRMWFWIAGIAAVVVILLIVGFIWWKQSSSDSSSDSSSPSSEDDSSSSPSSGVGNTDPTATSAALTAATTAALSTTAGALSTALSATGLASATATAIATSNLTAGAGAAMSSAAPSAKPSKTKTSEAVQPGATYAAQITWFQANDSFTPCHTTPNDGDYVVHVSPELWGDITTTSELCGTWITMYQLERDSYVRATIEGFCATCAGHNIDLSRAAFWGMTENMKLGTTLAQWWLTDADHQPEYTLKSIASAAAPSLTSSAGLSRPTTGLALAAEDEGGSGSGMGTFEAVDGGEGAV
ncbi:hypothetical protein JCM10213v2_001363 [Rhodosporidiobolus nylandii]